MSIYRINKPRNAQAKFHVKKNDEVVVLTGTQQGQRGKVLEVLRNRSRVIIEGVNFIKRHSRKTPNQPEGGIIEREGALHISKVMLAAEYDKRKGSAPAESEDKPAATKKAASSKEAAPKGKK